MWLQLLWGFTFGAGTIASLCISVLGVHSCCCQWWLCFTILWCARLEKSFSSCCGKWDQSHPSYFKRDSSKSNCRHEKTGTVQISTQVIPYFRLKQHIRNTLGWKPLTLFSWGEGGHTVPVLTLTNELQLLNGLMNNHQILWLFLTFSEKIFLCQWRVYYLTFP